MFRCIDVIKLTAVSYEIGFSKWVTIEQLVRSFYTTRIDYKECNRCDCKK